MLDDFLKEHQITNPIVLKLLSDLCCMFDDLNLHEENIDEVLKFYRSQKECQRVIKGILSLFIDYNQNEEIIQKKYEDFNKIENTESPLLPRFIRGIKGMINKYEEKNNILDDLKAGVKLSLQYFSERKIHLSQKIEELEAEKEKLQALPHSGITIVVSAPHGGPGQNLSTSSHANSIFAKPHSVKKSEGEKRSNYGNY
jgi:hypothetical protein